MGFSISHGTVQNPMGLIIIPWDFLCPMCYLLSYGTDKIPCVIYINIWIPSWHLYFYLYIVTSIFWPLYRDLYILTESSYLIITVLCSINTVVRLFVRILFLWIQTETFENPHINTLKIKSYVNPNWAIFLRELELYFLSNFLDYQKGV